MKARPLSSFAARRALDQSIRSRVPDAPVTARIQHRYSGPLVTHDRPARKRHRWGERHGICEGNRQTSVRCDGDGHDLVMLRIRPGGDISIAATTSEHVANERSRAIRHGTDSTGFLGGGRSHHA
jgi:hypothetical protein